MKSWIWWLIGVLVILLAGGIYFYTAAHVCFGCGESYCVTAINDQIKSDLDNLFNDSYDGWLGEEKIVFLMPPNRQISLGSNKLCGIPFAIQNWPAPGFNWSDSFNYSIIVPDYNLVQKCGLSEEKVKGLIVGGQNGQFNLSKGEKYYGLIMLKVPKDYPACVIKFELNVNSGNKTYAYNPFVVEIKN